MDGLAASMAQQTQAQPQSTPMLSVEEVMALLMEGIPPEQLEQQGVPQELIMQAIQMLEQQMAAQQDPNQGLAAKSVSGV